MSTYEKLLLIYAAGMAASFLSYLLIIWPLGIINARVSGKYYFAKKSLEAKGEKCNSLWRDTVEHFNEQQWVWFLSWLSFCLFIPLEFFATLAIYFKIKRTMTNRLRQIIGVLAFAETGYNYSVIAALIAYKIEQACSRLDPKVIASEINCMIEDMPSGQSSDSKHILGYLRNFFPELPESFYIECDRYLVN
ncbi:MAG: Uncharacterised protein [Opitutia bacterium UBA7350]|nr:MAG: Uncharacterised protein [Opitutae bacterium UBA7350]